jgi:hypothetical protein
VERPPHFAFAVACFFPPTLKNTSKNACQAPKPPNSNKTKQIEIAKEFHSIPYNRNSREITRPSGNAGPNSFRKNILAVTHLE